jgi:hypothetical protein
MTYRLKKSKVNLLVEQILKIQSTWDHQQTKPLDTNPSATNEFMTPLTFREIPTVYNHQTPKDDLFKLNF